MLEREIKIPLRNVDDASRLEVLIGSSYGAAVSMFQRDEYFDQLDGLLKRSDFVLRLRIVNHVGVFFAVKGPRQFSEFKASERIELEFEYTNESTIRRQLYDKGFVVSAVYEKKRMEWRLGDRSIAIDEVPYLGRFIEIEADSREVLAETIRELSLSKADAVTLNYSELLRLEMTRLGLPTAPILRAEFP